MRRTLKKMGIGTFEIFSDDGVSHIIFYPVKKRLNLEEYNENCMQELIDEIEEENQKEVKE